MKRILICFLFFFILAYPIHVFATLASGGDCSSIPVKNKIILKLSDMKDTAWLFLLMDPEKQISYRLKRADTLYKQSENSSNENLAYTYALRGEDHMTRLVSLIRTMSNTRSLDIQKLEQSSQAHAEIVTSMKSICDWQTIKQFIQGNRDIMKQLYYLRLPTDTKMQLLKEN